MKILIEKYQDDTLEFSVVIAEVQIFLEPVFDVIEE